MSWSKPLPPDTALAADTESRAAAVEQELQVFSYIVSHDLAASFRHVSEFSRLLLGELGDSLTEPQQSHVEHIRAATEKCRVMMEQLLVFSRTQQKPLALARREADAILQLALSKIAVFESAGAEIVVEPLGDVVADAELLAVIFQQLLDNAIKFRRPGVRPRILVRPAHDKTTWRMQIIDNGLGVEALYREKAFRMFHRLNGEDAYPGAGAGLAICRRIARRHGGEMTFLDCAEGACIELALPNAATLH
jgi:light-regulated signal transduction histidine kinase (bacteriophytochrome)